MIRVLFALILVLTTAPLAAAPQKAPGVGPTIVLETVKGTIEFETYPEEAPKTVARILQLVKKGFYTGLRFHRAEPNFLIQIGDPATRDRTREAWWGRGGSGTPIGVSEVSRKRRHLRGAVAMAHVGSDIGSGDSQFYILLRSAPELDGKYTVFGQVTKGMDVVMRIQFGDVLKRAYVKGETAGR